MQQPLDSKGPEANSNPWNAYQPGVATATATASATAGAARGPAPGRPPARGQGFKGFGKGLDKINWNGQEIIPVIKNCVIEKPSVANRDEEECEMMRLKHGITAECLDSKTGDVPKPVDCLEDITFPDWAAERMRELGCENPSPIQMQGWPVALAGFDLIGFAPTGSGKTMAYVLPMLMHIGSQSELKPGEGPAGLVLLPCRELCNQVQVTISYFERFTNMKCVVACGGEDLQRQNKKLLERADILVATPGRLIDLLARETTNLRRATFLVLDEADQMLDAGNGTAVSTFEMQVKKIMGQVRPDRQVLLFSATYTPEMEEFARELCEEKSEFQRQGLVEGLIQVTVGGKSLRACKDIDQQFWCEGKDDTKFRKDERKLDVLVTALKLIQKLFEDNHDKALVFVNEKETVEVVVSHLLEHDISCEGFRGDASRQGLLDRFREPESDLRILVSTQVLGRGLDIKNIQYVVNYDMPKRISDYIHRIGRTGRAGKQGYALTLWEDVDLRFAKPIYDLMKETREMAKAIEGWDDNETMKRGLSTPPWLAQEYTRGGHWTKMYRIKKAQKGEESMQSMQGMNEWWGRGRGRRGKFLEELQGTGLARDPSKLKLLAA